MKPTQVTMDLIEQYYIEVQDRQKFDVLCRLFDIQTPELAIIFTRTKRRVDEVTEVLKNVVTWRKASMAICLNKNGTA